MIECQASRTVLKYLDGEGKVHTTEYKAIIACDGANSMVKRSFLTYWGVTYSQKYYERQYIEISVPPASNGKPAFDPPNTIHMWRARGFEI